jgi:hypothetical protein
MNSTAIDPEAPVPVELHIRKDLYEAAMTRALSQGETLASVTRACYYAAAAAAEPVENPEIKPRPYGEERERIRFKVPPGQRADARKRIESSGQSVPVAVEHLLRRYIETGTIVGVADALATAPATTESE